jgi:hypothetical protein
MFPQYSRVKLVTDRYAREGGHRGMVGTIIEIYPGGQYEVEFFDTNTGITSAQIVVAESDIVAA